jgi:hypothetical protein
MAKQTIDIIEIRLVYFIHRIRFAAESHMAHSATTWLRRFRGIFRLEKPQPVMPRNRVWGGSEARQLAGKLAFFPADEELGFKPLLVMKAYRHFSGGVRMTGRAGLRPFKAADAIRMGRRSRLSNPGPQDESHGQKRNKNEVKVPLHVNLLGKKSPFWV